MPRGYGRAAHHNSVPGVGDHAGARPRARAATPGERPDRFPTLVGPMLGLPNVFPVQSPFLSNKSATVTDQSHDLRARMSA
ncbi:Uncharacterised protein [Amycolatopsis camponoti]|uniref:Uncharacterized protein n=1 Tax=Amycolatopsis camponoti TaxID=2606593 RepID=A0A6I8M1X8_9PSEU|nr:Uncharacterised protein [Amycolatopsis camponoti]